MANKIIHTNEEHFDVKRVVEGEKFKLVWKDRNEEVSNSTLIKDIEELVIPPNWENVLICSNDCGHIRATGYDEKGRKQYIYNERWTAQRKKEKFNKLISFATVLPSIRKKAHQDLEQKKWTKTKVSALVVLTLDNSHIRIGNSHYEEKNGTYGLTTLRRKHLELEEDRLYFEYKAKSNTYRKVSVKNNQLVNLIKKSSELPGYELFRYKENGSFTDLTSSDVNEYLHSITGSEYSAKDFRTWGGSVFGVEYLPEAKLMVEENKRLKLESTLVKLVAKELGNTPAVCRDYYIHPTILKLVGEGRLEMLKYGMEKTDKFSLSSPERKTLELIKDGM